MVSCGVAQIFLRNKVTTSIRRDSLKFNEDRIATANDEKEVCNIVNDVSNPKKILNGKFPLTQASLKIQTPSKHSLSQKVQCYRFITYFYTTVLF